MSVSTSQQLREKLPETSGDEGAGGRLVSADGLSLPLVEVRLSAEARGGIARSVLTQVFQNFSADPLQVTYQFPLPHSGAVSGFSFRLGGRRVVGEVDLVRRAHQRFEAALLSGRTAALVDQARGSLFVQELGNVPPGERVEAELVVDQRLDWLAEGAWEWRFPTVVAPRYLGAPGRVPDAARIAVDVADAPVAPRLSLALTVRDPLAAGRRPESPSHRLAFSEVGGALRAELGEAGLARLDRDLVVRWPAAASAVGLSLDAFRPGDDRLSGRAFGLLTVVPPTPEARPRTLPRDLVVLLDTSGSMSGEPLDQARRVVAALVDSLGDEDQLELVAFGSSARRWRRGAAAATTSARRDALAWLSRLSASGGTEMRDGIREALRGIRPEAQRQVVLVTDGLIGFEQEVVAELLATLPPGSRLHTVGVGSSVNRSLTSAAARASRGLEVVIGLGENPERAAGALRARTGGPLVTELSVEGSALVAQAPARLPDLFAGAPALISLELVPAGGALVVRGRTADGAFERRVEVAPTAEGTGGPAVAALFGREAVEDLELRLAAGEDGEAVDRAVEGLGLAFQLSTRLTSWVAVSEEPTVDPTRPIRRELVPQELPYGLSVEGLGLRRASVTLGGMAVNAAMMPPSPATAKLSRSRRSIFPSLRPSTAASEKDEVLRDVQLEETPVDEPVPVPERRLEARLLDAGDGRLVVEAEVGGEGLAWLPPQRVRVRLADGTQEEVEVEVDESSTTAAAWVAPGQAIRLVIRTTAATRASRTTAAPRASRLPAVLAPERIAEVRVRLSALLLVLLVKA